MAAELIIPPSRALDANASPYAGALFYFYESGTTTPQPVYTTAALNVAHANPVVADSGGKFPNIFMDTSLSYRGVMKNSSAAVTLYDIDPINTGALSQLSGSDGTDAIGFIQQGAGAVARTAQGKLRESPFSPEDYGAVGDNTADDTSAIQAAIDAADTAGGGTVQLKSGTTYKTTGQINLKAGNRLNLNEGKIRAVLSGNADCALMVYSNTIVENGHIEVDSTNCTSTQGGAHAPIRIGNLTSNGGEVGAPAAGESPSGWIVRNMIVESDRWTNNGSGDFIGACGIQVYGGASNGTIENITVPDNAFMSAGINMDWSWLGTISSTATYANMVTNRTNYNAGTAYTTHPNNISVRNIKIGTLSAGRQSGAVDVGSFGVRLSGTFNVTVENGDIKSVTYMAVRHTPGDLGFEFAQAAVSPMACKNNVFRNISVQNGSTAHLIYSDSLADNVRDASRTAVFTGAIAGATLTVSAVTSGTLSIGHSVYRDDHLVGVISALGTGTGGTGTYTLTGAVTTSSTTLNSGYGWRINPFQETNVVFDNIVGKGPGAGSVDGIRIIQQRGGVIRDCDVSYYKNGINVDEQVRGLTIERPHCHFNREHGILINHTTSPPQDVAVIDAHCHDNGQDTSGFVNSAGLCVGGSYRTTVERGRFGRTGVNDPTQQTGIWINPSMGFVPIDTVIRDPHLRSARAADGYGIICLLSTSYNKLGLLTNPRFESTYLLTSFAGLDCVPVAKEPSPDGKVNTRYKQVGTTGKAGLSVLQGDIIEATDVAAGGVLIMAAVSNGDAATAGRLKTVSVTA